MRIVFAPDGFKGTVTAADAARSLAEGWRAVRPDDVLVVCPMADGGEGTLAAFEAAVPGASRMPVRVTGPHDGPVDAYWLLLPASPDAPGGIGVVELASTSGIELLGAALRPWDAHTRGFGEAIRAALDHGVSRLVVGIGSSASTDGGVGMLRALGAEFLDAAGTPVADGARGLGAIRSVDLAGLVPAPPGGVTVLCDVRSPLLGAMGAAAIFGPQKGLRADELATADAALATLARHLAADPEAPGAGAAGGTGFALIAWGAQLEPGAVAVARITRLAELVAGADLVVTGEGSFDGQSAEGKAPSLVAATATAAGVPVALVAGRIAEGVDVGGFREAVSLNVLAGSPEAAMRDGVRWLRVAGERLAVG